MRERCRRLTFSVSACLVITALATPSFSQNLENLSEKEPVKVNGGLSLSQIAYKANGIPDRRDPYSYFLTGNINVSLYGWSVPFSFALSNQNRSFQQPFNQFGLHPTYKWATAHIGYASMNFSPYTLNGHIFRGVGVDLSPKKFHFSAMYGNLQRAVAWDSIGNNRPSFKRNGMGIKTGYRDGNDYAEVSLFHGKDDINSIPEIPSNNQLLPEENLVIGLSLGKSIFEKVVLTGEWATSALTRDTRAEAGNARTPFTQVGYDSRLSTSYYNAIKANASYQGKGYTAGVGYERIDPGYRTHGAYYFNNDLVNYTVNGSATLLDSKLQLAASGGLQHDNLDRTKISTMNRFVASLNVNYAPTSKLSLNANYSNFQSYTNIRSQFVNINQLTPYDNLDTLKFTQLSQSINVGANYMLGNNQQRRQMITANLAVQDAAEQQAQVEQNSGSRFYNVNTAYSLTLVPINLTMSLSYNANQNKGPSTDLVTHGPAASVNKSFWQRKMRVSLSAANNNTVSEGRNINRILNIRTTATYVLLAKHNFSLGVVAVNRHTKVGNGPQSFTEYTGTLTYSYSF